MRILSLGFPRSVFPFRSVSQRMSLDYDEIDEILDELFADLFQETSGPSESTERPEPEGS